MLPTNQRVGCVTAAVRQPQPRRTAHPQSNTRRCLWSLCIVRAYGVRGEELCMGGLELGGVGDERAHEDTHEGEQRGDGRRLGRECDDEGTGAVAGGTPADAEEGGPDDELAVDVPSLLTFMGILVGTLIADSAEFK